MQPNARMMMGLRRFAGIVGLVALGAAFAGQANAGCSSFDAPKSVVPAWTLPPAAQGHAGFVRVGYEYVSHDQGDPPNVVGLWKVTFTAKGNTGAGAPPDGALIDAGYVVWHADGTELMNSGRPPMTQSFCMGVWKQIGPARYKLNHFALSWDPTGTVFVGPANILEEVTLDATGNHYSGAFTIIQYAIDEYTVLAHITGTISASRLTEN